MTAYGAGKESAASGINKKGVGKMDRRAFLKACGKCFLIVFLRGLLEIILYGKMQQTAADYIVGCVLLWYIYKSEDKRDSD